MRASGINGVGFRFKVRCCVTNVCKPAPVSSWFLQFVMSGSVWTTSCSWEEPQEDAGGGARPSLRRKELTERRWVCPFSAVSDAIISIIPQLCLLPDQAAEVDAAPRAAVSAPSGWSALFLCDCCAQAAFPQRWFLVFSSVGPPDVVQSTPRRRKSLLTGGGSSWIRRRGRRAVWNTD